jgi:hypothetical protein
MKALSEPSVVVLELRPAGGGVPGDGTIRREVISIG